MGRFANPQHFGLREQDSVWTQKKKKKKPSGYRCRGRQLEIAWRALKDLKRLPHSPSAP